MAMPGLVLITLLCSCSLLLSRVFADSQPDRDGSTTIFRRCKCESVQFWLAKRTNGVRHLLSYEDIVSNRPNDVLLSRNDLDRGFRLWIPKYCDLTFSDNVSILQRDSGINSQSKAKKILEVWIKPNSFHSCIAAPLKCSDETLCVGIRTLNEAQSTRRKLLMSESNDSEKILAHQPYGILLSVLVFCSIIVLVALCGKAEKNSRESVARDTDGDIVKIVSSDKVESMGKAEKEEVFEVKVEDPSNVGTDSNSNNSKQLVGDVDIALISVTGDEVQKDAGQSKVDGAMLGKVKSELGESSNDQGKTLEGRETEGVGNNGQMERGNKLSKKTDHDDEVHDHGKKEKRREEKKKEKEDKHKEKDVRSKDRSKDMRSKRSNTSPENAELKPSMPKMRFSLKGSANSSSAYEEPKAPKRDKAKSKKKQESQLANARADRRSFVNRELPKRPSEERDNPPGVDDDSEDEHYEHVIVQGGAPRNPVRLEVPSQNYDNDSDLYDSVDDSKKPNIETGLEADINQDDYEVVDIRRSKHLSPSAIIIGNRNTPKGEEYECVSGVYEDPGMSRQRSFSDILPGSSNPTQETKRKTMSLGRENSRENAPTPPPLDHIQQVKQMHQHIIDDIEPYTITVKKGDRILQETSSPDQFKPIARVEQTSADEKDLYTEVDKEKQKRDRMESASSSTEQDNTPQLIIDDIEPYTVTMKKGDLILQEVSSADHIKPVVVRQEELKTPEEKEKLYTKVDKKKQKIDRLEAEKVHEAQTSNENKVNGNNETAASATTAAVEEHQYETMPRVRNEAKALQKADSFEQTEDIKLYEEVDTKDKHDVLIAHI